MPNKQTTFTSTGPSNKKVIVPENNLASDTIGRDTAGVKIAMDGPSPLSDTASAYRLAK